MRFAKICLIVLLSFAVQPTFASEYHSGVQAKVLLKTSTTSNGDPIAYLKTEQPEITVMAVTIAPGAETGWHSHPVPVYAYVTSGSLTVHIDGKSSRTFNAGEAIVEVVNVRHNGINTGSIPAQLIVFYAGAKNTPNVITASAP